MCVRTVFSAITGAIVAFAWCSFSWMILPWHDWEMKSFKNDGHAIVEAIKRDSDGSGIYSLPNYAKDLHHSKEAQKQWAEKAKQGPYVFVSMNDKGLQWDMNMALGIKFITQLIIALGAAILLAKSTVNSFLGKGFFVCIAVTMGSALVNLGYWNWWGFPTQYTLVNIADVAAGWLLAGLIMGLFKKKT